MEKLCFRLYFVYLVLLKQEIFREYMLKYDNIESLDFQLD